MKSKQKTIEINPASSDGLRWVENISKGWRLAGFADEIDRGMQYTGWFTDDEGMNDTLRGIVYRLPSRKGKPVFFVGYDDPNNPDSARGEIATDLDDETEAARRAAAIAERCAEEEREYNAAWRLGTQYFDTFETVERERATRKALLQELQTLKGFIPAVSTRNLCSLLKDKIRSTRRQITVALRERRDILRDNYINGDLIHAFADGAQITSEDARRLF